MSTKKYILLFASITIILTLYGTIKHRLEVSNQTEAFNQWINGWLSDGIKMRKEYHNKLNAINFTEIKSEKEYMDVNRMKEFKSSLQQLLDVELWKINKSISITNEWYNKIDPMLKGKISEEDIKFLKSQFTEALKEGQSFKELTSQYLNSRLDFTNFLLERDCKLTANDEKMYNTLTANIQSSASRYRAAVNNTYTNRMRRINEFNSHFQYKNIDILMDIVPDGIQNN